MFSQVQDKRLSVPFTDLKKKPTPRHLKLIAKQSASNNHPFYKVKEKKDKAIEEIFLKGGKKEKPKKKLIKKPKKKI